MQTTTAAAAGAKSGASISFGVTLSAPPTAHYIKLGDPIPLGCSGTPAAPVAEAGNLCVFENFASNNASNIIVTPTGAALGATTVGAVLFANAAAAGDTVVTTVWALRPAGIATGLGGGKSPPRAALTCSGSSTGTGLWRGGWAAAPQTPHDGRGRRSQSSVTQEHANKSGFETRAIHAGYEPDAMTGAVIPPIYATSTYKQDGVGGMRGGYEYSRSANPTRTALEGALAAVEEGEGGFAFASGLAAEDTLIRALTGPGDHAVIPDDAYGGTFRLFDKVAKVWGLDHSPAAVSDVDAMRAAIVPGRTKLVWVETPTNPMLNIGDIEALAAVAHDAGALLVVDNTFASPYLQQPLTLGADVVVHSTTKYVGGHSDVVGGARRRARPRPRRQDRLPPELHGRRRRPLRLLPDPPRAQDARRADGPALRQRREGRRVPQRSRQGRRGDLPRTREHPGHAIAAKQMKRFGGIISFRVTGGEQHALDVCAKARSSRSGSRSAASSR